MKYLKSMGFGSAAFAVIETATLLFAVLVQGFHPGAAFCIAMVIVGSLFGGLAGVVYPKLVGVIPAKNPYANGVIYFLILVMFPIASFDFLRMLTATTFFTAGIAAFSGALFARANWRWNIDIYNIY